MPRAVATTQWPPRRSWRSDPPEDAADDRRRADADDGADGHARPAHPAEEERLVRRHGRRPPATTGTGASRRSGAEAPADSERPAGSPPPSATRTAPTAMGEALSGPSARAVPVVPHSVAAATTSSDGGGANRR